MQERPPVTVSSPNGPERPLDVVGDDVPRSARPLVIGGIVLLLFLALLAGGAELWERRLAAQEERRLQSVVDLEATARFGQHVTGLDPETGLGLVVRHVGLRNKGPRDVTVLSAALGDLRLDEEVVLPAGQDVRLSLRWQGSCSSEPPPLATSARLELELLTEAGRHRAVVPLAHGERPPAPQEAQRACGYLPLEEAVTVQVMFSERIGDAVHSYLSLTNARNTAVRLAAVRAGKGLTATAQNDLGDPVSLPLDLPARSPDGQPQQQFLRLVLRVTDCAALDALGPDSLEPEALDSITFVVSDDTGSTTTTIALPQPGPLLILAERC